MLHSEDALRDKTAELFDAYAELTGCDGRISVSDFLLLRKEAESELDRRYCSYSRHLSMMAGRKTENASDDNPVPNEMNGTDEDTAMQKQPAKAPKQPNNVALNKAVGSHRNTKEAETEQKKKTVEEPDSRSGSAVIKPLTVVKSEPDTGNVVTEEHDPDEPDDYEILRMMEDPWN